MGMSQATLELPIGLLFSTMYTIALLYGSMANPSLQIKELKSDFGLGTSLSEEEDLVDGNRRTTQENSIFSLVSPPSLEGILQSVPPRQTADRRLSVYFNAKYAIIRKFRAVIRLQSS